MKKPKKNKQEKRKLLNEKINAIVITTNGEFELFD